MHNTFATLYSNLQRSLHYFLKPFMTWKQPTSHHGTRLQDAYDWLNTTFHWRPVFDWDWFVKPDPEDQHRNLDVAYADMQYGLEAGGGKEQSNALMAEIATQFQYMKDSGIPVHVLLGRRNPDESSLYRGWLYDAKAWEKSLTAPVDAGLEPVAAHIDTLSIFYDLRNPLDERRLLEIDDRQPYHGPDAHCPHPQCPCNSKDCPFKKQWEQKSGPDPSTSSPATFHHVHPQAKMPTTARLMI
jgi:hypothetical protein